MVQASLAESILMRVFRLMDPSGRTGQENASLKRLNDGLRADMSLLKKGISSISEQWENGPLSPLKTIRNKMLGHNDIAHRDTMKPDQLWFSICHGDFALMRRLAGMLWDLYRQCNIALRRKDVVEPRYASLNDRPAMLLKNLCASRYLDSLIDGNPEDLAKLREREVKEMGEDKIRPVFLTE